DFDASWPTNMQGQFTLAYDPYGADPLGHQSHTISVTRDSFGKVTEIVRTDPNVPLSESYLYSYYDGGGAYLKEVTQRRGPDSSHYTPARIVVFTYYPGGTTGGNAGDLESATVCTMDPCAAGNTNALDTSYYRYFLVGDS